MPDENAPTGASAQKSSIMPSAEVWLMWFGVAAVTFTALGALAGVIAWYFSLQVSRDNAARSNVMELRIAEQRERAANAEQDAAEAKQIASRADAGTLKAIADAATANKRAEELALETAVAKERAALAERNLLELRSKLQPRTLTQEIRAGLIAALKSAARKGPVQVTCIAGDTEGCRYANEILDCFKTAGWPLEREELGATQNWTRFGVAVMVRNPKAAPAHAMVVQSAMQSAGLEVGGDANPDMPATRVMVLVGSRPPVDGGSATK